MAYRITGSVFSVGQPELVRSQRTGESVARRDLVITVRVFDPYTGEPSDDAGNTPCFSFFGDRAAALDGLVPGDVVTVSFGLRGRAYERNGRREYFNDLRPLSVRRVGPAAAVPRVLGPDDPIRIGQRVGPADDVGGAGGSDDMPF